MKRVVLVRTEGPRNAGLAVRASANFAPCELWFVAPEREDLLCHSDFIEMSHGARGDRDLVVVESLEQALADCGRSIGFTARFRQHRAIADWNELRPTILEAAEQPGDRIALVFGNEKFGLSSAETDQLTELAWVPTADLHRSINLGMAVGIVLSGLLRTGRRLLRTRKGRPLEGDDREFLKRHLQEVLGAKVGSEAARRDLLASIERIFSRAELETRDARAWHRLLRSLGGDRGPGDFGLLPPRRTRRHRN